MPTDAFGRRAEVTIFGGSTIARLNDGQYYEQFINACADFIRMDVQAMVKEGQYDLAWRHLLGFYEIASPETYAVIAPKNPIEQRKHVDLIVDNPISLIIPGDNEYVGIEYIKRLMEYRNPEKTPVTFRNLDGNMVTTRVPVLIGSAAWITLDKSSFKPMAVAVAKRQGHGLPSTLNKTTKTSSPTNKQPSRGYAEAEIRAITAAVGGEATMDVVDLSVNPSALDSALEKLWDADNPMSVTNLIDRNEIPYGEGRSVGLPKHLLGCMGIGIANSK